MKKSTFPEISTLRAFIAAAQEGSTAAAADKLGVSQPAISAAIHRLEDIVGLPLFDRSSRPMQLTTAGRLLRERAEPIVNEIEHLPLSINGIIHHTEIDVRLGFSDSFAGVVSPFLLHRLLPKVKNLSSYSQSTPKIVQKLLSEKIDVAVATKYPSENVDINAETLMSEFFLIVTPKSFEHKIQSIHDVAQLNKALPVIRFNDDSLDSVQIERVLRQCGIRGGRIIAADTNMSTMGLVRHGAAWTVMAPLAIWMARDHMQNVAFHRIPSLAAARSFYVLYRHAAYNPIAALIAKESRQILQEEIIPDIARASPLLAHSIQLSDP